MKKTSTRTKTHYTLERIEAIVRALQSPYCDFAEGESFSDTSELYFRMTTELEILGITDEPFDSGEDYCVAANDHDLDFITEFEKNWPGTNPRFWELETYRKYYRARMSLWDIQRDYPENCTLERSKKINNLKRLP
jgi:hypothetical protein